MKIPDVFEFPPVCEATPEGLLAIGGDLSTDRLLTAYRSGIFPWFSPGQPILWWSPNPRTVLYPERFKISRSFAKTLRRGAFKTTFDQNFPQVIAACAAPRASDPGTGTWITSEMQDAYCALHDIGYAHSVEVWRDSALVGGLYGVAIGGVFFGESMFSRVSDASKVGMYSLTRRLSEEQYKLIDCQLPSDHLFRLGAENLEREAFLTELRAALKGGQRPGHWSHDATSRDEP